MRARATGCSSPSPGCKESALIRYRLEPADPDRHLFVVECSVDQPDVRQRFSLPSWIPGSYLLREYARHVVAIDAHCTDENGQRRAITATRIAKGTWECADASGTLTVRLTVFAFDLSVRGAYMDRRRAYFNGPCVFVWFHGREHEAVEVELIRPAAGYAADWRLATAMTPVDTDRHGFGTYRADDYDELIDHPVEIGYHERIDFDVGGVPHRLVVAGRTDTDWQRVADDLARVCAAHIGFFGAPPPFHEYWFLGVATGDGYGGLEHRASSSLIFSRDDLPRPGDSGMTTDYQRFLGLVSHEYFHSWHVKRVKPAAFTPYRLDRRNHTRLLWVFEGVTTYYQDLMLLRAGLISAQDYLRRLAEMLSRVYRTPGRLRHSLAESSFDAWDVLYKAESNTVNASVSYYSKGALTALALDLSLRAMTDGVLSLDDVVQALWRRFGSGAGGVPEEGFESLVLELAGDRHAAALRAFFDQAVRGTEDLPLGVLLERFGVSMTSSGTQDSGAASGAVDGARLVLGVNLRSRDGALELVNVLADSVAEQAGLAPGDLLIALDDLRVTEASLPKRLARYRVGDAISAHAFRGDELLQFELRLKGSPPGNVSLALDSEPDQKAAERRRQWLGA